MRHHFLTLHCHSSQLKKLDSHLHLQVLIQVDHPRNNISDLPNSMEQI